MDIPETRYTKSGEVNIAYQVVGIAALEERMDDARGHGCGRLRAGGAIRRR